MSPLAIAVQSWRERAGDYNDLVYLSKNCAEPFNHRYMTEIWKPVLGWQGLYEVSGQGRVRSLDRIVVQRGKCKPRKFHGQIMSSSLVKGYPKITLKRQGGYKNAYVHTMVCEAFHGPRPFPDWEVRHLNGNPLDNRLVNLKWGTKVENAQDSLRHGTNKEAKKTHCKQGHEFTSENTRFRGHRRQCRVCHLQRYASAS